MKKDFNRIGATLCSSMRPRSSTTSWLNKFKLLAFAFMALLSVTQVWGASKTITLDFDAQNPALTVNSSGEPNQENVTVDGENVHFAYTNGTNGKTQFYVTSDRSSNPYNELRTYAGTNHGTVTITSTSFTAFTSITVYATSKNANTAGTGTISAGSTLKYTHALTTATSTSSGSINLGANCTSIFIECTAGQYRIQKLVITGTVESSVTYTDYLTDCAAQEYNVTYHMNGGGWKGGEGAATYTYGVGIPQLATTIDRTGYGFDGWYDNEGLTGDPVTSIPTNATGDKEFWAKWNVGWKFMYNGDSYAEHNVNSNLTYTVHLDGNTTYWFRFSDGVASYDLPSDGNIMTSSNCTNWNFYRDNNKDCGIATTAPGDYTFRIDDSDAANKLVVSVTYPPSVLVTFDMNGHGTNTTTYIAPNTAVAQPSDPSAANYSFGGWYENASCTGDAFNFSTTLNANKTLYAKWTFQAPDYYYRGGDNSWGATKMTASEDGFFCYIQSSNSSNRFKIAKTTTGFDYNYLRVQKGYNNTDVQSIGDYGGDDCYCWQSGTYYILVYYPNTTINSTNEPVICAASELPYNAYSNKTIYFDNTLYGNTTPYLRIGRNNHSLNTAMTKVSGTANLYKLTTTGSDFFYQTFYAYTVANAQGSSSNIYDMTGITKTTVHAKKDINKDITIVPTGGDTYYNYNESDGMLMQNVSITEYSHGTVNVAYTDIDGSALNFTTGNRNVAHTCILTITATPETGARLVSLKVNGNDFTSGQTFVANATTVITAVFSNEWTLTWDYAGGTVVSAGTAAGSVAYGTTLTAPILEKTGYDFAGWNPAVPATMPAANSTYTAQWTASNYTVTLNVDGGTINSGNVTSYTYGTGATLPTDVTKTDYKFRGWYSNEGLTEGPVTAIGTTETGNKEFWAKWEETSYSNYRTRCDNYWYVTYDANGKEIAEDLPTDDYGYGDNHTDKVTLSTVTLTTTGYTHIGWNTNPAATTVLASPHTITGNTTFYAIWTPSVYTISYKDQGGGDYSGSNSALLPASHTYNTATDLVAGVKEGARFEGWYKDASCTEGPVTTLGATEYTGNITLYAKWTAVYAITYTIPTDGGTLATGAQTSAASGETVTMPGLEGGNQVPAPYDCETLIGWTTNSAPYESKTGAMPTPFYAVGETSPIISGATTFYAVYSRAGQGASGTISLTSAEILANWGTPEGASTYDVMKYITNAAGTWSSNGYSQNTKNFIQLRPGACYLSIPEQPGNLTTITITHNSNSGQRTLFLTSSTSTTPQLASQSIPAYQTETELDVSDANVKGGYIYVESYNLQIFSVTATYGAPNIISTGLNCNNDILEFTVTYNANAGQFPGATTACTSPDTHTFNGDDPETNPYTICSDATCAGMTLVGWNSQADGQGGLSYTPGQEISSVSQDEFTLYAQFAYNVTVKDNDATTNVHPSERDGSINLNGGNDVCDHAKYDFIGWTTDPTTWKQTITKPAIFSADKVTTYTPTAVGTQVTAVYGMSTSVGSQAFYISYNDGSTIYYLKFNGESKSKTTVEAEATAMYRETIDASENKYHLYYMNSGVKTYFYYNNSDLAVSTSNPGQSYGWVITTDGSGVSTFRSIIKSTAYLSYGSSSFTTHTLQNKKPLTITTGAKEYKYYDETTCTDEITITFNAGGGTMDPVTTQVVGHEGDVITVPTCSYPGWNFLGWVNTPAEAQTDIKKADDQIYTNDDGHEYEIPNHNETLYAYYTKTPEPPVFDGNISDVWKIYVPTVDGSGNNVDHYEVGAKDISSATAHGEYATTTRCIDATDWAFTNVGTNQFTIQNPAGLYLNGDPNGDKNDIYFSADPSVWTMEAKSNGFYKFVNQNTLDRYLAFQIDNGSPTFINTSTANEGNSSYSYVMVGGCADPVYTTSPGGEFKLNMLGNVRVTSTSGKTVRSVDALSISADNLTPNTAITLTDDLGVLNFCNETGAALSLTTDANGKLANTAVYVKYTPTAYNTTETPTITATCGEQHQDFAGLVKGRSLPEKFIIAQKVGDDWYALPNNMTNSQTNPAAVKISVVNEETGTATIYSDVTDHLAYQLQSKRTGTGMAFSSPIKDNYVIKVNTTEGSSTIGLYAQSGWNSSTGQYYEFTPVTSDLEDYTLQNVFQTNYLGITEGNWGIGASNNVRFLAINQKAAPTLTWKNMMMDEDEQTHATTKAEDGLVVLPGEPYPVACERAIETGWVFDGWVKQQIDGNRTTDPTDIRIYGGESQTTSRDYVALFTNNNGKWRTSCPTVNTITYKANGGDGADYVQYVEGATTATAVSVTDAGFSKEGSLFVGWTKDGDETGALIQPGATISGISGDIIINAVWLGELTITGDVRLTSAVSQKVATAATGITFSSTDMSCATELRITYRDETNEIDYNRSTYAQSEFRLCDGSYHVADERNIDMTGVTDDYNQTYSITYTPKDGANTLDYYTMKVEVLYKNTVIATVMKNLYGRTLPEKFAIVAHVGDMWYALPNNMATSNTYAPVAVSVDNSDASIVNWTATGAKTAGYSMKAMTADYNKLRFAAIAAEESNQKCLWASTSGTGIQNYSYNSTDSAYRWTVTPQDANFQAYTLVNEKNTRNLRYWSAQNVWGMYASGETNLYFIPLTDMEVADFQVIEWFANKVLIETNNQAINTSAAKTSVGSGEYAPATVDGTTYGTNQYTLTTGDLTTSAGQPLNIQYQTTAGDAWYINRVKIPIIVSQGTYTTSESVLGGLDKSKYQENDLVVRDTATLTMDATTGTWNKFVNVTIYPKSKVIVPAEKTLKTSLITMRGGYDEIYKDGLYTMGYDEPQLYIGGTCSATQVNYEKRVDLDQMHGMSVPFAVEQMAISYLNGASVKEGGNLFIDAYDGKKRADYAGTKSSWYYYDEKETPLYRGVGYTVSGAPMIETQNYAILRFPMATDWTDAVPGSESVAEVEVTAYGKDAPIRDNHKGWNCLGNPYLANFGKADDATFGGKLYVGQLVKTEDDKGNWTGGYHWDTESAVRYVTIPHDDGHGFDQVRVQDAVLKPFRHFFVQVQTDGILQFAKTDIQSSVVARLMNDEPEEIELGILMSNGQVTDNCGLLIGDDFSEGYEMMSDLGKELGQSMAIYTITDEYKLAFNAMNENYAKGYIPVGYLAPKAGEYTISFDNDRYDIAPCVEHIYLLENGAPVADLKSVDYGFETTAGTNDDRFALNIVFNHNIGTDLSGADSMDEMPVKIVHNDKMYILMRGKVYSTTGKFIKAIKK